MSALRLTAVRLTAVCLTAVCLTAACLLAACSRPAPPPAAPVNQAAPETQAAQKAPEDPAPTQAPSETTAPSPRPVPEVLALPAPGALKHVTFKAGDAISSHGVYFLNTTTGAGEGWVHSDETPVWGLHFSDDNRFALLSVTDHGYLVDRNSDAVWQWDSQQAYPLLASAGGFFFAEYAVETTSAGRRTMETGRYFWTGPDFKPIHTFALGAPGGWGSSALLSPDGGRVALLRRMGSSEPPLAALLYLDSGGMLPLAPPPAGYVGTAFLEPQGDLFHIQVLGGTGSQFYPRWHLISRRFNWIGKPMGDLQIPGNFAFFSPDGRWVAFEAWPAGDIAPATIIARAATLQPRIQALGTTPCFQAAGSSGTRWLADSSGLVVNTPAGYRILTTAGELQTRPAFAGLTWKDEPQPAPDHPDRFAIGRRLITNGAGIKQGAGVTLRDYNTPSGLPPWGLTSSELRFALPPPAKGGACTEQMPLAPKVLLPSEKLHEYPLVVQTGGSCLNLRDRPHTAGGVLACLPDGVRLAPTGENPVTWVEQDYWLWVRTEKGETGWVALSPDHLTWAVAPSPQ